MLKAIEDFERWSAEHRAELEAALTKQGCTFDQQLGTIIESDEIKQAYFESCYRRFQASIQEAAAKFGDSHLEKTEVAKLNKESK